MEINDCPLCSTQGLKECIGGAHRNAMIEDGVIIENKAPEDDFDYPAPEAIATYEQIQDRLKAEITKVAHLERTSKWITDSRALKLYKERAEKAEKERDTLQGTLMVAEEQCDEQSCRLVYLQNENTRLLKERDAALEEVKKYEAKHNTYVLGVMAHEEYRKQTEAQEARYNKYIDQLKSELDRLRKKYPELMDYETKDF